MYIYIYILYIYIYIHCIYTYIAYIHIYIYLVYIIIYCIYNYIYNISETERVASKKCTSKLARVHVAANGRYLQGWGLSRTG